MDNRDSSKLHVFSSQDAGGPQRRCLGASAAASETSSRHWPGLQARVLNAAAYSFHHASSRAAPRKANQTPRMYLPNHQHSSAQLASGPVSCRRYLQRQPQKHRPSDGSCV
eukprot:TRINITY_DN83891_c0_g1_i1.p2 TRINITY_DN83891_c0_g1~~TRINITY_DN83891_c0_g1_i1.p2  ORF type:complete len:111 (-),score=17.13 TRINITY_DN83891_c0_g1_i1:90-422(-)